MSYTPAVYADAIIACSLQHDGEALSQLFLFGPNTVVDQVLLHVRDARPHKVTLSLRQCQGYLKAPWEELAVSHIVSAYQLSLFHHTSSQEALKEAWDHANALLTLFLRHFTMPNFGMDAGGAQGSRNNNGGGANNAGSSTGQRWALPILYVLLRSLSYLAVLRDSQPRPTTAQASAAGGSATSHQEECARQLNKAFTACVADRSSDEATSRKWGTYQVTGMIFRGYFRLKSLPLCRNILRALSAAELPDFSRFPRAQRTTFRYYTGVLHFLNEDYAKAEADLNYAFDNCHVAAVHNRRLILQYLIPARLLRGSLPAPHLLSSHPSLSSLYNPFLASIRSGNLSSYDVHLSLSSVQKALIRSGTYLAFEKAREVCLRGLLKSVWRASGAGTRVKLEVFQTALEFSRGFARERERQRVGGVGGNIAKDSAVAAEAAATKEEMGREECEWLVAGMIYKGYMKGYLSHERQTLVLSAQDPFPKLGSFVPPVA